MSKPYESWSEIEQGIDDTYSEKDFLAVIDRDRFTATLSELDATKVALAKCCDERRTQTERAEKAVRDLAAVFENLDLNSLNKSLAETRRERDEARAERDALARQTEERVASMALGMAANNELIHRTEHDAVRTELVGQRDRAEAEARALAKDIRFTPADVTRICEALECPPDVDEMLTEVARLQEAVREDLRGTLRAERDSLRERLGDAERVLTKARAEAWVQSLEDSALRHALYEFDAKWGKAMKAERDMWEERANNPRSAVQLAEAQVALNAMREKFERIVAHACDPKPPDKDPPRNRLQNIVCIAEDALSLEAVKLAADAQARRDEAVAEAMKQAACFCHDNCGEVCEEAIDIKVVIRAALAKVKP